MAMLDDKQKELLTILCNSSEPILLEQLQKSLNTSRRTIYYIVNKINDILVENTIEPVKSKRGQGYYIDDKQKVRINKLFVENEANDFLKPQQRIYYLICWLLYPMDIIHVETIMQQFDISRNTVFNDLKNIKTELKNYDITLETNQKEGYYIDGISFNKRTVLLYYLKLLLQKVHYRNLHFLNLNEVETYYNRLIKISSSMGNEYNVDNLISIACLLSAIRRVNDQFEFSLLELKDLGETSELQLIDDYFQDFNVHERLYLAVHLLGSKASNAIRVQEDENDICIFELSQRIANLFEHRACIHLVDKNELINSLYMHFKLSMYYSRLSIQTVNPLMNEVKNNYNALYEMIKIICEDIKNDFPFPLSESEIVYITMHFGGHLRKGEGKFYRQIRVLVVCPSGVSTSMLLRREIEDLYSNVNVVATAAANDIFDYEDVDFIVSTIDIKSDIPWIKVHTILSSEDKSRIASLMMLNFETYEVEGKQMNGLFDIIQKYVHHDQIEQLKQDVFQYLRQGNIIVKVEEQKQLRIFDVLKTEYISVLNDEINWRNSIQIASQPLLENNYIRDKYIDAMIELIDDYGPYIVLQNKVAIAHANPDKGANMLGLSLLINQRNIVFEDEVNVQFLFVLSNPDQEKHLHLLRDIMLLSANASVLQELLQCNETDKILEQLKRFSEVMQNNEVK